MKKVLLVAMAWPLLTRAQTVAGSVTMGKSGLPVRGARLVLIDSVSHPRMAALADSTGFYSISITPGSYQLRASGPTGADETFTPFFEVAMDRVTHLDVALASSTRLASVRVDGKREVEAPAGNPHKFDEFFRRRDLGAGHFMTKEQIAVKNARRSPDLLAGIPGLKVRQDGDSTVVQSARCSGKSIPGLDTGTLVGGTQKSDNKMRPMLFIDGHRVWDTRAMDDIAPGEIEAIEVYQGASELPAEAKGDACFAIYIWLKAGT